MCARERLCGLDLFPDAVETLTTLSGFGMRIELATNGPEDLVNDVIGHFDLHDVFDFTVASSQVGSLKPSKRYSDFLIEQAEVEPHEILVVGDGEEDAMTAEIIGATFIFVNRGQHIVQKGVLISHCAQLSEIVTICLNSLTRAKDE